MQRLGSELTVTVLQETERMGRESTEGQAIELGWRRDNLLALTDADYFHMVLKKTCWYTTIHPIRLGALIGTRDGRHLDRFVRFGFFLGAAFQIQDDLLNLDGDEARYGKEIGGDLLEGKRTLMLIRLLRCMEGAERARLAEFLALPRTARTSGEVGWIRERMEAYACLDWARQIAHAFAGAAQHEFEELFGAVPDSRDRRFIEALPRWVLERS
jgi:geranylgeranyl diphosphate synthase type II